MDDVQQDQASKATKDATSAKNPVCGMTVNIGADTRHAEFQGKTFTFCSEECQMRFTADPSS